MVLRGVQIHRCGPAGCVSLTRRALLGRTAALPFWFPLNRKLAMCSPITVTREGWILNVVRQEMSFRLNRAECGVERLPRAGLPDAQRRSLCPIDTPQSISSWASACVQSSLAHCSSLSQPAAHSWSRLRRLLR